MIRAIWIACVSLFVVFAAPTGAIADKITFNVQSMAQQKAEIVFYSLDRRVHWPGPGPDRVYPLKDYGVHHFSLSCITNEKICYGAWTVPNRQFTWGEGPGGRGSCSDCCYTCRGNGTELIVLRNRVRR
jgi:hypothetical protein